MHRGTNNDEEDAALKAIYSLMKEKGIETPNASDLGRNDIGRIAETEVSK